MTRRVSTVAFTVVSQPGGLRSKSRDTGRPQSGYKYGQAASERLAKICRLTEMVGGKVVDHNRAGGQIVCQFPASSRGFNAGLGTALLSQKGFPRRRGIQVGLVTSADAIERRSRRQIDRLALDLSQAAEPGQILVTGPSASLCEHVLKQPITRPAFRVGREATYYDLGRVVESRHFQPMAKVLESLMREERVGVSPAVLRAAVDASGPYRNLMSSFGETALEHFNQGGAGGGSGGGAGPPDSGKSGDDAGSTRQVRPGLRYLRARFPEEVQLGEEYRLLIQVVIKGNKRDAPLKPLKLPAKGLNIELSLHAPGFEYKSKQIQRCHITRNEDSDPVFFDVVVKSKEPGPLEVTAFCKGTYLGRIVIETRLAQHGQRGGSDQQRDAAMGSGRAVGDKTVTLAINWMGADSQYEITLSKLKRGELYDPERIRLKRSRRELVQAMLDELDPIGICYRGQFVKA